MTVRIAVTDAEIAACYPVLLELRPHLEQDRFLSRVRAQERAGYRLAFLPEGSAVVAVAGFRLGENLAYGRYLYVDDLVTAAVHRSQGHGAKLLGWLRGYAAEAGCARLHLDSGVQRKDAHRFYEREGMALSSFHFVVDVKPR